MTGLANEMINAIVSVSGQHLIIALVLTMLCSIVLGMGVPTTATYCIMAATCAPILIRMGVPAIAAHFFVFYFGIVSDITPPVALAAYAGAAIAKANPMKTAFIASKLAIAAFIVPYVICYNPALILVDAGAGEIAQAAVTAFVGIFAVAAALEGYLRGRMNPAVRIIFAAGGLLLVVPGLVTDLGGFALIIGGYLIQRILRRTHRCENVEK